MISFITEYIRAASDTSLAEYMSLGGFQGLRCAVKNTPESLLEEVKASGLKGRGGAFFPTGIKWETFFRASGSEKYIVCNGDEGEPGTFKDRYLLDHCCWQIFEGMILAAYATGVEKGFFYLRGEYGYMLPQLCAALDELRKTNLLGTHILGSTFSFDIEIRSGAGAYICGEESALLSSLEGLRGLTRVKPPLPVLSGLWGCPTLIDNVETFACVTQIVRHGSERFRSYGTENAAGTKLVCLSGCLKNTGIFEIPFGTPLSEIIYQLGGGAKSGQHIKFLHLGGLSGACVDPCEIEQLSYDPSGLRAKGLSVGTGAIFAASDQIDYIDYLEAAMWFFREESCGRCIPCREGTHQICRELECIHSSDKALGRIARLLDIMEQGSSCGLGQAVPVFVRSLLRLYEEAKGGART